MGSDSDRQPSEARAWREAAATAGSLGVRFALIVALGAGLGFLLDRACGWAPIVWTPALGLLGGVVGFLAAARRLTRDSSPSVEDQSSGNRQRDSGEDPIEG